MRQNKNLTYLQCSDNSISSLDVSGLDQLVSLYCESNRMTSLDLTGCTALEVIYCRNNRLPEVDFSTNTRLKFIEAFDNRLTRVDLSMLKDLEFVHLDHNRLTDLDLSGNASLSPTGSGFVARNNHLNPLKLPVKADLMVDPDVYFEQDPKTGYERVLWYADAEYSTQITEAVQANGQTLYAKWVPNTYTITFDPNGGSGSLEPLSCTYDQSAVLPSVQGRLTPPVGKEFAGWATLPVGPVRYPDGASVRNLTGQANGSVTLYAVWRAPVSEQYVKDLDAAFSAYQAGNYAAQDWEVLTKIYTDAAQAIVSAEGADHMKRLYEEAVDAMGDVAAWTDRAAQTIGAWKSAHDVVSKTAQGAVTADNAAELRLDAHAAMIGLNAELVESATGLLRTADQEQVLALVMEDTASDFQRLTKLGVAAAWVESLNGLPLRPLGEVTADWLGAYTQACNDAADHQADLSASLLGSLTARRELAGQKCQALAQLQSDYERCDLTRYTADNQARLAAIWSDGAAAIQQAASAGAVSAALSGAQNQLKAVPVKDQPQQPDGGVSGGGGSSSGGGGSTGGSIGGGSTGGFVPPKPSAPQPSAPPAETAPPTQPPSENTVTDPVSGATAVVTDGGRGGVSAQITLPKPGKPAVLTIPAQTSPSTVAVVVAEDGARTVLPWSVPSADGLALLVSQSCRVELEERSASYSDVQAQSWYGDAVAFTSARGLFSGVGGGRFAPEHTMSRAMLASVLYRMDGAPSVTGASPFSDVPDGRWDSAAVQWAAQAGIVSGTGEGRFSPEAPMIREALVTMLYRYANQAGLALSGGSAPSFADGDQVSAWAADAVNWACGAGILQGSGGQLRPGATATRAEVAAILMRFTDLAVRSAREAR